MVSLGENLGEGGSVRTALAGELLAVGLPDGDVSIAEKNIKKGETSKLPVITFIKTFFFNMEQFPKERRVWSLHVLPMCGVFIRIFHVKILHRLIEHSKLSIGMNVSVNRKPQVQSPESRVNHTSYRKSPGTGFSSQEP